MCSFRQDLCVFVPCPSCSHSPAPHSFSPVLSTRRTEHALGGCCNELLRLLHTQDRRCESRNGSDMVEAGARRRFSVAHRDRLDNATHLGIDL